MPLYRKLEDDNFSLAIWRIEEDLSFFESKFREHPPIINGNRRLQWFASRHLLNEVLGEPVEIIKDESGKPALKESQHHISISHTAVFAGVIVSHKYPAGIDMEMINPKVERIAHKFLREDEINSINEEEKIRKLILYWSAKEALYKFYGKTGVEFKTQLLIAPFELGPNGELSAEVVETTGRRINLTVRYDFFEDHVLSYVVGR